MKKNTVSIAMKRLNNIDLNDVGVKTAIEYIEGIMKDVYTVSTTKNNGNKTVSIPWWNKATTKDIGKLPWIYFAVATNDEEKKENLKLVNKYKNASIDSIEYYLLYHNCDFVSVLVWAILKSKAIKSEIVNDGFHRYCISESGRIYDPLMYYCNPDYKHKVKLVRFKNPIEHVIGTQINTRMDISTWKLWEFELLVSMKKITGDVKMNKYQFDDTMSLGSDSESIFDDNDEDKDDDTKDNSREKNNNYESNDSSDK